jgi:uncharacterized membrane protein
MDEQRGAPAKADWSFQFNPPTLICFLYIAAYFTVISAVVGVILAYVWRREDNAAWEDTHYTYLIRTFWLAVLGLGGGVVVVVAVVLIGEEHASESSDPAILAIVVGMVLAFALIVLLAVRCALSLVGAQRGRPMPRPRTWLA